MSAPAFSDPAVLLVAVMAGYLGVLGPVLGRRRFRELARLRAHDPTVLARYYKRFLISWWLVSLSVPAVLILSPGLHSADLGLTLPSGRYVVPAGAVACAFVAYLAVAGQRVARMIRAGEVFPARHAIAAALPGTPYERRLAAAVAVTAGIVEEVYFRGLLVAAGVGILGLPMLAAAGLSLLLFAVGHLYQGPRGVVGTGIIGAILTALYLATGSLLLPMIVHALVDINALLLIPASTPEQIAAAEARQLAAEVGSESEQEADDITAVPAQSRDNGETLAESPLRNGLRPAAPGDD